MYKLISGIVEFREKHLPKHAERFRELALAQSPDTLMVTVRIAAWYLTCWLRPTRATFLSCVMSAI